VTPSELYEDIATCTQNIRMIGLPCGEEIVMIR